MKPFEIFCDRVQDMIAGEKTVSRKIENGRELVSELVSRQDWFFEYLGRLVLDPASFDRQKPGIWPNELTLYRSPDKSFLVLAYIWEARQSDFIHDHGAWGVIGTLIGKLGEKKYDRLDDGNLEGFCELQEASSGVYGTGETTFVLPLNKGLHAMDNPTDGIAVSVNVYGKTIGRGYILSFDPVMKTVTRVFPPRNLKEILAVKTLAAIDPSRAEGVLREALGTSRPPSLRKEYEETLAKIRGK